MGHANNHFSAFYLHVDLFWATAFIQKHSKDQFDNNAAK